MISAILTTIAALIQIYTLLCVVTVFLSWIPGARESSFGKILVKICDPYLNIFSKITFLRLGNIDFSPVIAIALLSLISSVLSGITRTGRIYFGAILATIINLAWSLVSTLLFLLMVIMIIRWIILARNKGITVNSAWYQIDTFLSRVADRISKPFSKGTLSYKQSLLISWIAIAVILLAGYILISFITSLCGKLPF